METRRNHLVAAGALLLATALAGAVARGSSRGPIAASGRSATFAAPMNGLVSFTGHLDRTAVLRGQDGIVRMELVIGAKPHTSPSALVAGDGAREARRPTDVVIVLDRSGSMAGDKIEQARAAVRALLAQLGAQDRFALVTYSNDAAATIPLSTVDARGQSAWAATLAAVHADGGTNMSSGIDLGVDLVERARESGRVPHLVLISDGLANQGDASYDGLVRRAQRAARGEYMLSAVGVGADFNEYLMSALADAGTGNYYYLQQAQDLATVFAREFDAARSTVAAGLAVQIQPGVGVRVVDAAGYPLETADDAVLFRPGSLFAGQERRIWVALEVPSAAAGDYDLGRFSLSYGEGAERTTLTLNDIPRIACVQQEEEFYRLVDVPAWSRSVVVDAYNKMQSDVAREVKAGRRDAALERVRRFKDENAAMNAHLRSPQVMQHLVDLGQLESDVSSVFQGADQEARQNELSKAKSAAAVDARRAGSKK